MATFLCLLNSFIDIPDILQGNFECGHVVSEKDGGNMSVDNLKPICGQCNRSMGSQNMNDYVKKCNF